MQLQLALLGALKPMGADGRRRRSHLQAPFAGITDVMLRGPERFSGMAFGIDEDRSGKSGFWLGLPRSLLDTLQQEAARAPAGQLTAGQGGCQFLMDHGSLEDSVTSGLQA